MIANGSRVRPAPYYGSCLAHETAVPLDSYGHCPACRVAGYPGRGYPAAGPFHVVAFDSHASKDLGVPADVRTFATSAAATTYANRDGYPYPLVSTVANDPAAWPPSVRRVLGARCAECGADCYWYTGHAGPDGAPRWTHAGGLAASRGHVPAAIGR